MRPVIDYRNARYQGETDETNNRQGFGILIDDDLSLYASAWRNGRLHHESVIYISHGKYIYGQWHDNQPHGLNVFRIGDTVVLGEFDRGRLRDRVLIIFEKLNFLAILEEKGHGWAVIDRGTLKSYNDLLVYIQRTGLNMKPHFYSLSKFLAHISTPNVTASICPGTQNCYFGYQEGLGIVFNPNNGVISVGAHRNRKIEEFGGIFDNLGCITQGNFKTKQIIKYSGDRPKTQIYSIYQKLHKRSLNFKNQYFDSKVKLLHNVEELIRARIDEIVSQSGQNDASNNFSAVDLNDSLDYHAENLQILNKMKKTSSRQGSECRSPLKQSQLGASQKQKSPQRSGIKNQVVVTPVRRKKQSQTHVEISMESVQKSQTRVRPRAVKQIGDSGYSNRHYEEQRKQQDNIHERTAEFIKQSDIPREARRNKNLGSIENQPCPKTSDLVKSQTAVKNSQTSRKDQDYERISYKKYSQLQQTRQQQPTQSALIRSNLNYSALKQNHTAPKPTEVSESPIRGPNYQDLSQRRKRLINQFKNLNAPPPNPNQQNSILSRLRNSPLKAIVNRMQSSTPVRYRKPTIQAKMPEESPCARQKFSDYESKNTQQSESMMPLTLFKQKSEYVLHTPTRTRPPLPQSQHIQTDKENQSGKYAPLSRMTTTLSQNYDRPFLTDFQIAEKPVPKNSQAYQPRQGSTMRKQYKYYFEE